MVKLTQYMPRRSPVHDRDPRVKLIALIIFSLIILYAGTPELAAATCAVAVCAMLARIPLLLLLKALRPFTIFFTLLFAVYIFFTPGRPLPLFSAGWPAITCEGLDLGIHQIWKFSLLVLASSIFTVTTSQTEITMGLERLLRPCGKTGFSSDLALMVSLALRFIPLLLEEADTIREAQLARGADLKSRSIRKRIRLISHIAIPLILGVFRRCDELADAMEARGYHQGPKTYLQELRFQRWDYLLLAGVLITAIADLVWRLLLL
jgi:biotin transport system permease protein/energy-coupling factor transport system permease protein